MFNYTCLNPIAGVGLDLLSDEYNKVDDIKDAQAVLVRSAAMHDLDLPESLLAIARAGAGVNNIPLDKCADKGVVVFNTPGANANGVKELVLCGMLLASRDIIGGNKWVDNNTDNENISKDMEKAKKELAYLVSRDTNSMDVTQIVRSILETISENTVDGVIAPMFFAFVRKFFYY